MQIFAATYHFARHLLPQINKAPGGAVIRINSRDAPHRGIGIQTAQKRAIDVTWRFCLKMLGSTELKFAP